MKKILIASLSLLVCTAAFAQKKVKSPIDGRIYTITLTEENKKKAEPVKDEASFMGGKFKSTFMQGEGFLQTDYESEVDSTTTPVSVKFTVEAKNDSNGRFSWEGTCSGDVIDGTVTIRKKGKIEHTYTFHGTWKNKKKVKPAPPAPKTPAAPADSTGKGE